MHAGLSLTTSVNSSQSISAVPSQPKVFADPGQSCHFPSRLAKPKQSDCRVGGRELPVFCVPSLLRCS